MVYKSCNEFPILFIINIPLILILGYIFVRGFHGRSISVTDFVTLRGLCVYVRAPVCGRARDSVNVRISFKDISELFTRKFFKQV